MKCILILIYVLLLTPFGHTQAASKKGQILIISSYNPDTRRVDELITNLADKLNENEFDHLLFVESLNISSVSNVGTWTSRLNSILERYRNTKLQAIVLIGQEAWAASISERIMPKDIPLFVVNASHNGLLLTDPMWNFNGNPKNVSLKDLAIKEYKLYGGHLYNYDIDANIKLIRGLFPNVKEVAFISDNTYGGIALRALMKASEDNYPDLTFKYIDARLGKNRAITSVKELSPGTSAMLLATWRIDGDNRHMMHNSLEEILSHNQQIPLISLTGVGIDEIAIGGCIPMYKENGSIIAKQILDIYVHNDSSKVRFSLLENHYKFNKELIEDYHIEEYRLPKDATILSSAEKEIQKYKYYVNIITTITILLLIILCFMVVILRINIILKHNLQKREYELIIARDSAQESDRLKSAFLANMSHEIRTPLNAIIGFSSIISEQEGLSEDNMECQRIITENSEILLALISDILDLSRLEFGNIKFEMDDVVVRDLCRTAMASASCTRGENVEGLLDLPNDNCIISADYRRIMQVINNLLGNANKFTESGYVKLSYSINYSENKVYFYVEDTGCGVPIDKQKTIFQRFEKIDDFKQGAGLGLSICKNILNHLNSDMWIDSSYTGGARFVFSYEIKEIIS